MNDDQPSRQLAVQDRSLEYTCQISEQVKQLAIDAFEGGFAPNYKNPVQVWAAMMHGRELGLAPFRSINSIAMINGRPCLWGDAMLALIRKSGTCAYVKEYLEGEPGTDERVAVCETLRFDEKEPVIRRFSIADAKRAGLWGRDIWSKYPQRMLQMRARSWCLRDTYSDVLAGLGQAEEMRDTPPPVEEDSTNLLAERETEIEQGASGAIEVEPDTSDIPEADEQFFQKAKLVEPKPEAPKRQRQRKAPAPPPPPSKVAVAIGGGATAAGVIGAPGNVVDQFIEELRACNTMEALQEVGRAYRDIGDELELVNPKEAKRMVEAYNKIGEEIADREEARKGAPEAVAAPQAPPQPAAPETPSDAALEPQNPGWTAEIEAKIAKRPPYVREMAKRLWFSESATALEQFHKASEQAWRAWQPEDRQALFLVHAAALYRLPPE